MTHECVECDASMTEDWRRARWAHPGREADAHFKADPVRRSIEWGAGERSGNQGRMEVTGTSSGSTVLIRLHAEHEHGEAEINRTMDETVSNIERLLSGE